MQKDKKSGVLKFWGVVLVAFGIIYAILGTIALMGQMSGVLPGHAAQETALVALAYAVALFGLIAGIICIKGSLGACRVVGIILALLGIISLIYTQVAQDSFNIFDCIALVLGVAIFTQARKKN